jgi:hypothetical protein
MEPCGALPRKCLFIYLFIYLLRLTLDGVPSILPPTSINWSSIMDGGTLIGNLLPECTLWETLDPTRGGTNCNQARVTDFQDETPQSCKRVNLGGVDSVQQDLIDE